MNNIKTFENFNNQDIFTYIENNDIQSVKDYINSGYNLDSQNNSGDTPLILAASNNKMEIVKLLLNSGADINRQDNYGGAALIWAAFYNRIEIVKLLLNAGADIDKQSNNGNTALIWSAFSNNKKIIELLLDYGADEFILNAQNKSFYDFLNIENKEYFTQNYPTSVYKAIYHNYKKSFTDFVKDYNIKIKK